MNTRQNYHYVDGHNVSEQHIIFCRLIQLGLPLPMAAEGAKMRGLLHADKSFMEIGLMFLPKESIKAYMAKFKLPEYVGKAELNLGKYTEDILPRSLETDFVKLAYKELSIKRVAFCWIVALGHHQSYAAQLCMMGTSKKSWSQQGWNCLKDQRVLGYLTDVQTRLFFNKSEEQKALEELW